MKTMWILGSLILVLAVGSVQVAESKYEARKLMSQIEGLKSDQDSMRLEWSQLILEKSTLSDETIIYQIAKKNLGMSMPTSHQLVLTSN